MGPAAFVVVLVIALIISAQLTMMLDRHRTLVQRLQDLGWGGDAFGLLWIALLLSAATGALIGSLTNHPGPGAVIGLVIAIAGWVVAVVLAHRGTPARGKHTSS